MSHHKHYLVEIDGQYIVPIGIKVGRGKGSYPVLHKNIMFITTTGDGDDGGAAETTKKDFSPSESTCRRDGQGWKAGEMNRIESIEYYFSA